MAKVPPNTECPDCKGIHVSYEFDCTKSTPPWPKHIPTPDKWELDGYNIIIRNIVFGYIDTVARFRKKEDAELAFKAVEAYKKSLPTPTPKQGGKP